MSKKPGSVTKDQCISGLEKKGFTVTEATEIVESMLEDKQRLQAEGRLDNVEQKLAEAWTEKMDNARRSSILQKRHAAINVIKRQELDGYIKQVKSEGFDTLDALEATLVGSSKTFTGARSSAMSRRWGTLDSWIGGLVNDLEGVEGALPLIREDIDFSNQIIRETYEPGSTKDPVARDVAAVFEKYSDLSRQRQNAAGADIGRLEGRVPRSHDAVRMLDKKLGKIDGWVKFMHEEIVDIERSFPDIAGDPEAINEALQHIFTNIVTGRGTGVSPVQKGLSLGPKNLASGLGKHRVLHFRSGEAEVSYHARYGSGNIMANMVKELEFAARRTSLMETFGPNPEVMIKSILEKEKQNIRVDKKLSVEEKDKQIDRLNRSWEGGTVTTGPLARWYAELNGETFSPVNQTAARISSAIRGVQSLSKLGGATLSAIADVFVKANALRHRGKNLFESWDGAFRQVMLEGRTSAEQKVIMRQLGTMLEGTMNDIYSRFNPQDQLSGAMSKTMNTFFKYSGLTGWTEAHKAGFIYGLANDLGIAAEKGFDAMDPAFQTVLKRQGVTPERWEVMRNLVMDAPDGRKILSPERAHLIPDSSIVSILPEDLRSGKPPKGRNVEQHQRLRKAALQRERQNLETELMGLYADECRYAIIEPDDRTRAAMVWGTRPGTPGGEALRFITQFKSFPIAYYNRVMKEGKYKRAGESGMKAELMGLTHFISSSLLFGYIAMSAKDFSKGRTPKDPAMWETWLASAVQSGGAGIFGDLLFSKVNRAGNSLAGTVAGPTVATADRALTVLQQFIAGDVDDAGADALRFVMDNTPFLNLWYTRSAVDYMLLFHIREMLSPGSLRRTERKLKREYNQEYMISPSKVIKRGGGFR